MKEASNACKSTSVVNSVYEISGHTIIYWACLWYVVHLLSVINCPTIHQEKKEGSFVLPHLDKNISIILPFPHPAPPLVLFPHSHLLPSFLLFCKHVPVWNCLPLIFYPPSACFQFCSSHCLKFYSSAGTTRNAIIFCHFLLLLQCCALHYILCEAALTSAYLAKWLVLMYTIF